MRAGDLKDHIIFQRKKITQSEYGGESVEWEDAISARATVVFKGGKRIVDSNEIFNEYTFTFYVRIYHQVDESMRIKYNGKSYKILSLYKNKDLQGIEIIGELINE